MIIMLLGLLPGNTITMLMKKIWMDILSDLSKQTIKMIFLEFLLNFLIGLRYSRSSSSFRSGVVRFVNSNQ